MCVPFLAKLCNVTLFWLKSLTFLHIYGPSSIVILQLVMYIQTHICWSLLLCYKSLKIPEPLVGWSLCILLNSIVLLILLYLSIVISYLWFISEFKLTWPEYLLFRICTVHSVMGFLPMTITETH